ncbi:DUF6377 domain-containing protein [Flavobacterium sp. RNTU_13]|uniref:DUF6377 domain-containing protein n=1 Tax=Flavobacterium sp. RNTU_13 TaxID=3375145 RepID=UPI003986D58E
MRYWRILLLLFVYTPLWAQQTLAGLDAEINKRSVYEAAKKQRIAQLQNYLTAKDLSPQERFAINGRLVAEYIPYKFTSAVSHLEENIRLAETMGNITLQYKTELQLAELLSSSGNYAEAADVQATVNRKLLPDTLLSQYYYGKIWLNFRLKFYSAHQATRNKYDRVYNAYTDSLLARLQPGTEAYLNIVEMRYRDKGDYLKNREANLKRLSMATPGERPYSSITFFLAQSYLQQNNTEQYKKYLVLSAISDIKSATRDCASLTALAVQLFKEGDIERAHRYINIAFEDASFYNSRLRLQSVSSVLPLITKTYDEAVQKEKSKLTATVIIISVLSVLLLCLVFYIWKQYRNLKAARHNLEAANSRLSQLNAQLQHTNSELKNLYGELADTNRVKEYYIGTLLNFCSDYLDKLDVYRKTVNKMIIAKQVTELLDRTKSPQLVEEEIERFYKNFDSIFLHIYPDFVAKLNALLLPDEQIQLKKGELLNTELRVFALIRLGITDSAGIAKLLRYSVNTIYNYRVKTKNKAISRDDFEEKVLKIGAFSSL